MRLIVLGDLNLDVFARFGVDLRPGEEARSHVHVEPGGSAGTFARVAAALGADVIFIGSVGRDMAGDMLERSLRDAGVTPSLTRSDLPTGTILALQQGEERSMVCSRGANDGLTPESLQPGLFIEADHLHVSGYALLSAAQRATALAAMRLARDQGRTVSIDPPPANLIRSFGIGDFQRLLEPADWLFPNLTEGEALTGLTEIDDICDALALRFKAGALTLGPDGAIGWQGAYRSRQAVEPVENAVNTGAGDTFAAGFVTTLHATNDLTLATARACEAAHSHVERLSRVAGP